MLRQENIKHTSFIQENKVTKLQAFKNALYPLGHLPHPYSLNLQPTLNPQLYYKKRTILSWSKANPSEHSAWYPAPTIPLLNSPPTQPFLSLIFTSPSTQVSSAPSHFLMPSVNKSTNTSRATQHLPYSCWLRYSSLQLLLPCSASALSQLPPNNSDQFQLRGHANPVSPEKSSLLQLQPTAICNEVSSQGFPWPITSWTSVALPLHALSVSRSSCMHWSSIPGVNLRPSHKAATVLEAAVFGIHLQQAPYCPPLPLLLSSSALQRVTSLFLHFPLTRLTPPPTNSHHSAARRQSII